MQKLISYVRVSSKQQGQSALGLEAQQAAIATYAKSVGGEVLREYREVESGKKADRPELAKALAHARRARATLVIAKLDRLARNVYFLSGLMEAGVDFVACDNPTANRLTLHILSAVAEDEARREKAAAYRDLVPEVAELRARGLSLRAIARELDASGHSTRRGKTWNPQQVGRVLALA